MYSSEYFQNTNESTIMGDNNTVNQTIDIDEHVAYNLANTIVKRRFT